jgi:hypothetical protein
VAVSEVACVVGRHKPTQADTPPPTIKRPTTRGWLALEGELAVFVESEWVAMDDGVMVDPCAPLRWVPIEVGVAV